MVVREILLGNGIGDDPTKVQADAIYMSDMAMLWLQMHQQEVEKGHTPAIKAEDLEKELKKQFYPVGATFQAMDASVNLRHSSPIREYTRHIFTSHFLTILPLRARQQVKLAEQTNLASTLKLAVHLVNCRDYQA